MSDSATAEGTWRSVPRRMLLADDTYEILREALITNRLEPGRRLNIEQLAQDLNVSITPIRHALVRLQADGFVTREPYKGYVASELLDRATVAEIFETRIIIETELVAKAATRATKDDLAFLGRVAKMDPTARFTEDDELTGGDVAFSCDAALHRRIAVMAGNKTLVEILDGITKRMSAYRTFKNQAVRRGDEWIPTTRALSATKREHAAIVQAIRKGDGAAAKVAMRRHLENASRRDIDPIEPEAT